MVNRPYPKLAYKFFGPFEVLDKVGSAAYRLALPPNSKIHNVFHISRLKPFTSDYTPVFSDLGSLPDLSAHNTEPEAILDHRLVKKGNSAMPQVLVKWSKIPAPSATWIDLYVLQKRFPAAPAWGQAASQGGSTVMTQPAMSST